MPVNAITQVRWGMAGRPYGAFSTITAHELTAVGVSAGVPTVGSPGTIGERRTQNRPGLAMRRYGEFTRVDIADALTASDLSAGSPVVGSPALTQRHVLLATSVAAGTPSVGSPECVARVALIAADLVAGTPEVGLGYLAVAGDLLATSISAGTPTVGRPRVNPPAVVLPIYYLRIMQ